MYKRRNISTFESYPLTLSSFPHSAKVKACEKYCAKEGVSSPGKNHNHHSLQTADGRFQGGGVDLLAAICGLFTTLKKWLKIQSKYTDA